MSLEGDLVIPADANGTIVMVPGAGVDRRTPPNVFVASELNGAGFATLLFDLLTPAETAQDKGTAQYRFAIDLLAARAGAAVDFVSQHSQTAGMPVGLYGVGSGAAAALACAAEHPGTGSGYTCGGFRSIPALDSADSPPHYVSPGGMRDDASSAENSLARLRSSRGRSNV